MEVTVWKNSQSEKVGSRYGLRIGAADKEQFFARHWTEIEVEMEGVWRRFQLEKAFWTTCPEFRDEKNGQPFIREWLERHRSLVWDRSNPPKVQLVRVGDGRFRLVP